MHILEIGSGTGSAAVAMAEQGAEVTGIEVEEAALTVARQLCKLHGVQVQFLCANATDAHEALDIGSYDHRMLRRLGPDVAPVGWNPISILSSAVSKRNR